MAPIPHDTQAVIDSAMKALIRRGPRAILRLAGVAAPETIRIEDANLNLPELRADHVLIVGEPPSGAVYLEYQLVPSPELLIDWFAKCAGLTRQLDLPVALLAVFLQRGDRTTFPDAYRREVAGLPVAFEFTTVKLWEHAELIRSGVVPELTPLLVLCDEHPTTETVREEIRLIRAAEVAAQVRSDLLAVAIRVASRRFPREILEPLFREELPMLESASIIDEWILEGEARGRAEEARRMALTVLDGRFVNASPALRARIESADSH